MFKIGDRIFVRIGIDKVVGNIVDIVNDKYIILLIDGSKIIKDISYLEKM